MKGGCRELRGPAEEPALLRRVQRGPDLYRDAAEGGGPHRPGLPALPAGGHTSREVLLQCNIIACPCSQVEALLI